MIVDDNTRYNTLKSLRCKFAVRGAETEINRSFHFSQILERGNSRGDLSEGAQHAHAHPKPKQKLAGTKSQRGGRASSDPFCALVGFLCFMFCVTQLVACCVGMCAPLFYCAGVWGS